MEEKPLLVEIVAYAPTAFYHCQHCEIVWQETGFSKGVHEEQIANALPPDLQQDYQAVSDWVNRLFKLHGDRVVVKIVDAASIEGFWKILRHGLKRYPAVVIENAKFAGTDFGAAEAEITNRLGAIPA